MWYANVYRGFFSEGGNYSVQNHTQTRGCRSMLPREYFASRYLRLLLRLHTKYYIHIIIIVNNDSTQLFELDVWSGCTIIRLKRRVQIHLPVYGSVLMYDVHCFHTISKSVPGCLLPLKNFCSTGYIAMHHQHVPEWSGPLYETGCCNYLYFLYVST